MSAPARVLASLVDVTLEPPSADTDAADVLDLAQRMSAERVPLLDELRRVLTDSALDEECTPLLAVLRERDARWMSRLIRAQHELQQRVRFARSHYPTP